jgi:transposase
LELRLEALQLNAADMVGAMPQTMAEPVARAVRGPLPAHLPRDEPTHLPKHKTCPDCGGELRKFGEDASELLERIPAQFQVLRHVRVKLTCTSCERIVQAAAPSRPIERGMAGPRAGLEV